MEKPKILTILLTYSCNLNCSFCGQRKNKANPHSQLSLSQVESILDSACKAGIQNVNLWGGEPLLHPQIFEIIRAIKKRRMRSFLVTNGLLLEKYADDIIESRLDFLQVSIDGINEDQDNIRNLKGLFKQIEKGINKINSKKRIFPIISSCTVIHKDNADKLFQIADHCLNSGINAAFFQMLMSYPGDVIEQHKMQVQQRYGIDHEKLRAISTFEGEGLSKGQFEAGASEALKMKEKYGKRVIFPNLLLSPKGFDYYNQTSGPFPGELTGGCWSLNYKINVEPNGNVVACPDFPDIVLGNIFENSIEEIWNSDIRLKLIEDFYKGNPLKICYKCCQLWDKEDFGSFKGVGQ